MVIESMDERAANTRGSAVSWQGVGSISEKNSLPEKDRTHFSAARVPSGISPWKVEAAGPIWPTWLDGR
jgi:hypothetical protein